MGTRGSASEDRPTGAPPAPATAGEPTPTELEGVSQGVPTVTRKRSVRQRISDLRTRTDEAKRSAAARAEDLKARHASARIAFAAYERDRRQAGGLLAGGLAFRIFLWLLPAGLVVVTVFRLIADLASESPEEVARSAGLGAALRATVAQAADASGRGAAWLLILGIVLMLWAGVAMVKALRLLAGVAWQVRPAPLTHAVRASTVCSAVGIAISALPVLLSPLYAGGLLSDLAASLITIAAIVAIMVWVMRALPRPDGITWPWFVPGALLIGIGAEILRLVTTVYFAPRLGRTSDLYGALGLAAVFLAWLYLLGRLFVGGMNLNAELWRSHRRAESAERPPADPDTG
jgi:uncharacterized BrkB/YihY/UPF0761 family membrane protein